ncbi:hypothetical protein HPB50_027486 [Hyalomma asiaticum]|uniref:Uncharacterized protein n=1 Tax=Hyalomma asiaticum TaxID=266040 RepID=A0ACB7T6X6_HYAAI|nr:hypothetical protein HPB50_027486 [Hyalomma asiaticum]
MGGLSSSESSLSTTHDIPSRLPDARSPDFASDDPVDTFQDSNDKPSGSSDSTGHPLMRSQALTPNIDDTIKTLWERVNTYQKRIEEILFEDRTKISNAQRALIITETNNMVQACAEFQAMAAWRDGVVAELRRQLDDARREAADLRVAVALGATPGPSRSYASVLAGRSDGVPTTPYSQDRPHVPSSQQPVPEPDYRSPLAPTPPSASHVAFLNLIGARVDQSFQRHTHNFKK